MAQMVDARLPHRHPFTQGITRFREEGFSGAIRWLAADRRLASGSPTRSSEKFAHAAIINSEDDEKSI